MHPYHHITNHDKPIHRLPQLQAINGDGGGGGRPSDEDQLNYRPIIGILTQVCAGGQCESGSGWLRRCGCM